MKKYIKPTIKCRAIDTEAPLAAESIVIYETTVDKDDEDYVEGAKMNPTWNSYNPWGDDED